MTKLLSKINRIIHMSGSKDKLFQGYWGSLILRDARLNKSNVKVLKIDKSWSLSQRVEEMSRLLLENKDLTWIPSKLHSDADMYMVFMSKNTRLGKAIAELSKERLNKLYSVVASITQYAYQPFSSVMLDVNVKLIHEENVTIKNTDISVPYGDGQLYAGPNASIWHMANNFHTLEGMKVIGKATHSDFIFLKGVVARLSMKEWLVVCKKYNIDPSFDGIVANQHAIKDKLGFLSKEADSLQMTIGYHADNRSLSGKQILGSQAALRSVNYKKALYHKAYRARMEAMQQASKEGNWKAVFKAAKSDPSKLNEGQSHMTGLLGKLEAGLPFSFISISKDRNVAIDKATEQIVHSCFKSFGRFKVKHSTRTYPFCDSTLALNECAITPKHARVLHVSVGDQIVIIRSPKSAGYPALVLTVVDINSTRLRIHPAPYTIISQGDFDGDAVAMYKNGEGLIQFKPLSVKELITIMQEKHNGSKYNQAIQKAWKISKNREVLESAPEILRGLIQGLLADQETGGYDNLASVISDNRMTDDFGLRNVWNNLTQVCITNKKHVGDALPEAALVARFLGLSKKYARNERLLLAGKIDKYESLLTKLESLSIEKHFKVEGLEIFNQYWSVKECIERKTAEDSLSFVKSARAWFDHNIISNSIFKYIRRKMIGNVIYTRPAGRNYKLVNLIPSLNTILNDVSFGNDQDISQYTARWNALEVEMRKLFPRAIVRAYAYQMLYTIALFEPVKRWILTRDLPEDLHGYEHLITDMLSEIR